jgi:SOCE-associated regulatory factor of calcium homoeostasis
MKPPSITYFSLLLSLFSIAFSETPPGQNAILLSKVQTLTLHAHRMTWYRRVEPIHQLKCVGPSSVCRLHEVDTMRCTNQGYDYDEEDIQWSCTASLPPEFKLGSTDVICEGYRNAEDKWVLKGSCGVEYRLLLTEKGEERYGRHHRYTSKPSTKDDSDNDGFATSVFAIIFIFIFLVILYAICYGESNRGNRPGGRGNNNGGGGDDDDPPPPYDSYPQSQRKRPDSGPGFWTGAAAGGAAGSAAGYAMGRRHNRQQAERETSPGPSTRSRRYDSDRDEPRSSRNYSPTRVNTGFGSTRRR